MTVTQLAKKLGIDSFDLLSWLRSKNYQIPSVNHKLGGLIVELTEKEYKVQGNLNIGGVKEELTTVESVGERKKEALNLNHKFKNGHDFESAVGDYIADRFPNSHLSNVFLFLAEQITTTNKYGREIDHLMHFRRGGEHRIVIFECKHANLELEGNQRINQDKSWIVETAAGRKEVREQMWIQIRALFQILKPIPEIELVVEAIALLSDENVVPLQDTSRKNDPRVIYRVMGFHDLDSYFSEIIETHEAYRVSQSEFLRRLRQGMCCSYLGHPDIRDAIEYHRRSRQTLDFGLFKYFKPKRGKWAINGTAGMGKSVLLAYAVCAISTNCRLDLQRDGQLKLVQSEMANIGLPPLKERRILVFSLKEKQRRIIEKFWKYLIGEFQNNDHENKLFIQRPILKRWQLEQEIDANILIVDEAHDLSPQAQKKVSDWLMESPNERYLIIACDRHQKLRLIGDSEHKRMILGLNFSGYTTALKRVYRNPFAVYAAGLGLMFRWFAPSGAKVLPDQSQLEKSFGFKVMQRDEKNGSVCKFEMTEDAHPGNHWHHCVSNFPDAATAYQWLSQYNFCASEVLWVRFNSEDQDFDYEVLNRYQYHNLHTSESPNIIDKYIKGQEFPIVVVEGVSPKFNDFEDEIGMFASRRELYLCTSRATVFLFFIYSGAQGGVEPVSKELEELRKQLCRPLNKSQASQKWGFQFNIHEKVLPLTQFEDLVDPLTDLADIDVQINPPYIELDQIKKKSKVNKLGNEIKEIKSKQGKPKQESNDLKGLVRKILKKVVEVKRLRPPLYQKKYTVIDVYSTQVLEHYLGLNHPVIRPILEVSKIDFKAERLSVEIIKEIAFALDVPVPWKHPEHGSRSDLVNVEINGSVLNCDNFLTLFHGLCEGFGVSQSDIQKASENILDPSKEKQNINLIEYARITNELGLDGDLFLSFIKPVFNSDLHRSGGFSVLQEYTPRILADYLDVKPFKVMGELMKSSEVMNLSVNNTIKLSLVEFVCESFGKPAPWCDEVSGDSVPEVVFNGKVVVWSNVFISFEKVYKDLFSSVKHNEYKLSEQPLSATQVYELLKDLNLRPEPFLRRIVKNANTD